MPPRSARARVLVLAASETDRARRLLLIASAGLAMSLLIAAYFLP